MSTGHDNKYGENKNRGTVLNRKFNVFWLDTVVISLVRQDVLIFSLVFCPRDNNKKSSLTREINNFRIQQQNIEYPLRILNPIILNLKLIIWTCQDRPVCRMLWAPSTLVGKTALKFHRRMLVRQLQKRRRKRVRFLSFAWILNGYLKFKTKFNTSYDNSFIIDDTIFVILFSGTTDQIMLPLDKCIFVTERGKSSNDPN